MRERPILFSAPMVRAILEGRKTQTRRVVSHRHLPQIPTDRLPGRAHWSKPMPYGQPGDRLWVKETYRLCEEADSVKARETDAAYRAWYEADLAHQPGTGKLRPSIFMPRWASRITLEVTGVRVERLQDVEGQHATESDAIAEGVHAIHHGDGAYYYSAFWRDPHPKNWCDPADAFRELWEGINGPGSWDANPWVWVVEFKRLEVQL